MQTMQLLVRIEGATAEEIDRAGQAAMAVFAKAGVTPLQAAEASFAREGGDVSDFNPDYQGYDGDDAELADLWQQSSEAAAAAACADWPVEKRPQSASLEITGYANDNEEDDEEDTDPELLRLMQEAGYPVTSKPL